jgi:hypothetical protein
MRGGYLRNILLFVMRRYAYYSDSGIGLWKDLFNIHLPAMMQYVERALGILTRRWSIFWRPLFCAHCEWSLIAMACAKLHNFRRMLISRRNNIKAWLKEKIFARPYHSVNNNAKISIIIII